MMDFFFKFLAFRRKMFKLLCGKIEKRRVPPFNFLTTIKNTFNYKEQMEIASGPNFSVS